MPNPLQFLSSIETPDLSQLLTLYKVYFIEYFDASIALHSYTYALFVETHQNGTGSVFRIRGNVYHGMVYECTADTDPSLHAGFSRSEALGTLDYWRFEEFQEACEDVAPPGEQMDEPLYRSLDWCEDIIRILKVSGALEGLD